MQSHFCCLGIERASTFRPFPPTETPFATICNTLSSTNRHRHHNHHPAWSLFFLPAFPLPLAGKAHFQNKPPVLNIPSLSLSATWWFVALSRACRSLRTPAPLSSSHSLHRWRNFWVAFFAQLCTQASHDSLNHGKPEPGPEPELKEPVWGLPNQQVRATVGS